MKLVWVIIALLPPLLHQVHIKNTKSELKRYWDLKNYLQNARRVIAEMRTGMPTQGSLRFYPAVQSKVAGLPFANEGGKHISIQDTDITQQKYGSQSEINLRESLDKTINVAPAHTKLQLQLVEHNGTKRILLRRVQMGHAITLKQLHGVTNWKEVEPLSSYKIPSYSISEKKQDETRFIDKEMPFDSYESKYHLNSFHESDKLHANVQKNETNTKSILEKKFTLDTTKIPTLTKSSNVAFGNTRENSTKTNIEESSVVNSRLANSANEETNPTNAELSFPILIDNHESKLFIEEISAFSEPKKYESSANISVVDHIDLDSETELMDPRSNENPFPFEGSGELEMRSLTVEGPKTSSSKASGRFIDIFGNANDTSTKCTTPKNEPGYCRHFRHCMLEGVFNNFNVFLQYTCMMKSKFAGICCPVNPVTEVSNPDEDNSTDSEVAENLPLQPADGCGVNSKTRIVGGTVSKPHEWTWMVALLRRNRFFCGGALINNVYVLTAAHCTLGLNIKDLKVRLGEYNLNNKTKQQQDIGVLEIKRHAKFTTLTFQHDIALLKLRRPVAFTRFVGTICLPQVKDFTDVNATVVGWGTVSFGGAASPVLRQVKIPVLRNSDCDRMYALESIDESFMCAGSPEDEQDACQGDSGGPLMSLNDQGRWQVIGLVSWGRRCGDPDYPGVYTRVTTYLDWIHENTR